MKIKCFVFSPFYENTYVLSIDDGSCWIIDPGCYDEAEENELVDYITSNNLTPTKLINTHCHLDHVFGNAFVCETYNLKPVMHKMGVTVLEFSQMSAAGYGVKLRPSPMPINFIDEGDVLKLGAFDFQIYFTPGHAPDHVILYNKEEGFTISGDVLFENSIGRTDLPGGEHETLLKAIKEKMFVLPDETKVYSGHGNPTTIGHEKANNPFFK